MKEIKKNVILKRKIAFALNIIIFLLEIPGLYFCMRNGGLRNFIFFTVLSNVLAMIVSAIYVIVFIIAKGDKVLPNWIKWVRYIATNCLALTFFIVITVLVPMYAKVGLADDILYKGPQLFHHILCPIFSFISFTIFEEGELTQKDILVAVAPTLLYAIVLTSLNVIKVITGPYPFLEVYKQPVYMSVIWFILILGISYGLAWFARFIRRHNIFDKLCKNKNEDENIV